jgi:hypothetical protein
MLKYLSIIFLLTACCFSQSLYIPLEFEAAYEDGTRSLDGKPGADYWQNKSDYKISVTLYPATGYIKGSANITYYNNSPDTLDRIVFRLYQNLNKKGTEKDFPFSKDEFTEGIVLSSLTINKKNYDVKKDSSLEYTGTNLSVKNLSIAPKKQATINVAWEFKVPKENHIRMGQYDSTTFFIAYWYPQIAVYDDIDGWDMIEYTGQTEFYNDFNNYEVNITVPNYYGIWATGNLNNAEQVLSPQILARYNEALVSDKVVSIINSNDYLLKMAVFNNTNETNTWSFSAAGVPDFTFGAAANYLWDGMAADGLNKKVFVSAAYKQASLDFYEVCEVTAKTVEMMSKDLPGIAFPFPKITIFNGGGGMESPMMVNQGSNNERIWMVHTTVHEVAHSYFPFYMGINERKYAWMDEGWAQMLSEYIQYELDKTIDFRARNVKRYLDYSGQFDEVPMMYASYNIKSDMYGNHAYFRPCNAYNILKDFMGDASFKKALQEYMKRWAGKHPTPYDFYFTFEDATDDELTWFFEPWFFKQGYPDAAIDTAFVRDDILKIQVTKEGELPIPVALYVKFKDGTSKKAYRSASVWKPGAGADEEDEIWIEMEIDKKPSMIELGNPYIPDADTTNNYWLFK